MEKLYKLLSDTQASLFVLFQKTWNYHWNVAGTDFPQLHELFGGQYETMFEEIDRISEHMRYLNIRPVSTMTRMVEVSSIDGPANGNQVIDARGMVEQLLADNEKLIEMLKDISEEAEKQRSYGTANLVQDLMETHGNVFVYKLRSYLQ
jgi:starvation-inducible DNA-binding protein